MTRESSTDGPQAISSDRQGTANASPGGVANDWAYAYTIASFGGLLYFSKTDAGWFSLMAFVLMAVAATSYLFLQKKDFREIFFYATVREQSPLQFFRYRQLGLLLVAAVLGIFLVLSLSVFLLTVSWMVLATASLPLLLFPVLRRLYWRKLSPQFKTHSGLCLTNFLTTLTLGLLIMAFLMVGKWIELKFLLHDYHLATAGHMADYVIGKVEHSLLWLQHLGRTLNMLELQVLRIHQYAEGGAAHFLLFYFLLPSTLAAFAIPVIFSGIYFLFKGKSRLEEGQD
ncbi:MAG: hypothetical protein JJT75_04485 [Opitutales bacterium]|nr:hypothetical protein [Opitutales bacterium]MCH8541651.1 hypothetical protein [Opitutales bacterium]